MRRSTSLDDALQDLSEGLQRRLVVLDDRMRVVAYSIHESDEDRARLSHLLAHSDTWARPPAGRGCPTTQEASDGTTWELIPLRDDRHRVGHLLHALTQGASPPDPQALADGAARLGVLLSVREKDAEQAAARSEELLTRLLAAGATHDDAARAGAELVDEGFVGSADQYCVALVAPTPERPDAAWTARQAMEVTLDFVARSTTATVAGGLVDGQGVLLFPRPVVRDRLARLLEAPHLTEVRGGIGGVVPDIDSARATYLQAQRAWRAACLDPTTHPRVTVWEDLGIDKLLLALPLDDLTDADLPAPVARLLASDHWEIDVPTIEAYLACGGDARATATALGIHRSTLYYRLTRIRATTEVDLADGLARRDLHTGLRVARLAGRLTR